MSPVLGVQLRKYICDIAFYACFPDGQLLGNLSIAVSTCDQSQHVHLARGQVVPGMIHEFHGNLLRYAPLSGMNSSNGLQEFSMDLSFEQISSRARLDRSNHLNVAAIGCQNDDP